MARIIRRILVSLLVPFLLNKWRQRRGTTTTRVPA